LAFFLQFCQLARQIFIGTEKHLHWKGVWCSLIQTDFLPSNNAETVDNYEESFPYFHFLSAIT